MTDVSLTPDEQALVDAAWRVRNDAVCTYSKFAVGASLRDESGKVWTGANVENASYTLGLCAERVALFYAVTHGASGFSEIAVVADCELPISPCGACRQILWEFAPNARLLMVTKQCVKRSTVAELLPGAFGPENLEP